MSRAVQIAKSIGRWLVDNPWAIITALVGVAGAYLLLKSKSNRISNLQDAVAVHATRKRIAADEARAEIIKTNADAKDDEVKIIDKRIAASKRRVMEIHEDEDLEDMNDDQVAALFGNAGL